MLKKTLAQLSLVTLFALGSTYTMASPATSSTVKEFIHLSHQDKDIQVSAQQLQPFFVNQATKIVQDYTGHTTLSAKEQNAVQELADKLKVSSANTVRQANIVAVKENFYAKSFTEEELKAYNKFLSTPEGQAINAKAPRLMLQLDQEINAATSRILNTKAAQDQLNSQMTATLNQLEKAK